LSDWYVRRRRRSVEHGPATQLRAGGT